jgi:hypothetical protein
MANLDSRIQFADGFGATQHKIVVLPAGTDANVSGEGSALASEVFANAGPADEDIRLGDVTGAETNLVHGTDYVLAVRTSLPALSGWAMLDFTFSTVGPPGPVTLV